MALQTYGKSARGYYIPGKKGNASDNDFYNAILAEIQQQNPNVSQWLNSLSTETRNALLGVDDYWGKEDKFLWAKNQEYDINALLADLAQLEGTSGFNVTPPNLQEIEEETGSQIDAENQMLLDSLASERDSTRTMYEGQMRGLNEQYGNISSNILSQNYQQGAALTDSVQSEMSRSRRNALEAGASAGMRLASNINTLMSVQNQHNTNALNTSNSLAQMLLNQRQAASGIQGSYSNYMSGINQQERGIHSGSVERKDNAYMNKANIAQDQYRQQSQDWGDNYSRATEGNPLAEQYRSHLTKSQY